MQATKPQLSDSTSEGTTFDLLVAVIAVGHRVAVFLRVHGIEEGKPVVAGLWPTWNLAGRHRVVPR
jgi:hypothetical protein